MSDTSDGIEAWILAAVADVQASVVAAIRAAEEAPTHDDRFAQAGLIDGDAIVRDYLANGEPGLALEHVLYMASELELKLSAFAYDCVDRAGRAMGMNPGDWTSLRSE